MYQFSVILIDARIFTLSFTVFSSSDYPTTVLFTVVYIHVCQVFLLFMVTHAFVVSVSLKRTVNSYCIDPAVGEFSVILK
jgi:hypothetical protein